MKKFETEKWILNIEPEKTGNILRDIKSDAESCSCSYCRNFILCRDNHLPDQFIAFLQGLGINPEKDLHTCHITEMEKGLHLYQIDYYFMGEIIKEPAEKEVIESKSSFEFNIRKDLNYRVTEFPGDGLVLECFIKIPWVADEE